MDQKTAAEAEKGRCGMSDETFAGLSLRDNFEDGEPRVRDIELGERLGYSEPRMVRRLVAKLRDHGHLPGTRAATARVGKTTAEENWLDERSALLVASQSGLVGYL